MPGRIYLRLLDRQGKEVQFFQVLDLYLLDQPAQLGDGNPHFVLGLTIMNPWSLRPLLKRPVNQYSLL